MLHEIKIPTIFKSYAPNVSTLSYWAWFMPIGFMCGKIVKGNLQCWHTSIVCKNLQWELVIGFDMQQLHHLGYDWNNNGGMFLDQDTKLYINSKDVTRNY